MAPDMKGVIYLNADENQDNNGNTNQISIPHEESKKSEVTSDFESMPQIKEADAGEPKIESEIEQKISNEILTLPMKKYIEDYRRALAISGIKAENPIVVDEIASKIASLYEKARRIIDWKEENLVRRTAIERILKRRLISEISEITIFPDLDPQKIAGPITLEFIRTGYFENGKIPEEKILGIENILNKYLYILKNNPFAKENALAIKDKVHFYNWILEIAACEIEEYLGNTGRETALIKFMAESIYSGLTLVPADGLSEETKYIQTYIATHKALFGLDSSIISYNVLRIRYPKFTENDPEFIHDFAINVKEIWGDLTKDLEHPKRSEFQRICEAYDAAYRILADMMESFEEDVDSIEEKLESKGHVENLIERVYSERLATLKARLFRSAIYSTLSIFVAGMASLLIFEYPIAKFFYGEFKPWALVADIVIPTALMFFLVGIIKPPTKDNLPKVVEEVEKLIYADAERNSYKIKLSGKIKKFRNYIFSTFYLLGGLASLYLIYIIFKIAGTPPTSLYINTANIALIVFAATLIRQKSREITIKERVGIYEFFLDFFSVPLAKVGAWLGSKWKEFNFVSVFLSTLVDTPFSSFIEILEDWRTYIKEKQAEIQ